jgi:hypothetical protein
MKNLPKLWASELLLPAAILRRGNQNEAAKIFTLGIILAVQPIALRHAGRLSLVNWQYHSQRALKMDRCILS